MKGIFVVLLVLIVIGALGFGAFWVYKNSDTMMIIIVSSGIVGLLIIWGSATMGYLESKGYFKK